MLGTKNCYFDGDPKLKMTIRYNKAVLSTEL